MNVPIRITATGDVGPANGLSLLSVTLAAGSDTATLVLKEGGSSGTQIIPTITAAANTEVHRTFPGGIVYKSQLHGTLTGTSPQAGFSIGG